MNISLDDMMVFAAVVEQQSFTKAADILGLGKARVSQVVSRLESNLNTRLLHRTTRSLSLTEAGTLYYQKCREIQEIAYWANAEVQLDNSEPSGLIRISTPVGSHELVRLLSEFLQQYPKISLDIIESDGYQDLTEERCDIAIRASSALADSSLYAVKIGEFTDMLCASKRYLERFAPVTGIGDLAGMKWLSHAIVHGRKHLVLRNGQGQTTVLNKEPALSVRTTSMLRDFVLTGEGFAVMPSFVIENELKSGQIIRILPELHGVTVSLYAVYQHKTLMPRKVRALIDFFKLHPLSSPL
ncbi:LysR family transcriptional regulator (plasmid) [Photobacterium sp. DA100]|uniref:LysR family transcriptional regulator n=1 Tax=Photobacterium sp. DA100 TaxID=3027472 RepID=UPI002478CAC8|nr:LysR family transcriptional regulator [Photobacterium sp. DA100]WEM44595.1 LysR family transcriptional regulator [Photobacterium sp. DA100]